MSNMSYCRFQNTSSDLLDCITALQEMTEALYSDDPSEEETVLSREEETYRRRLEVLCREYLEASLDYVEQVKLHQEERK